MKVFINDINEVQELSYRDYESGRNIAEDFITSRELDMRYNYTSNRWHCDSYVFEFWARLLPQLQQVDHRICRLRDQFGWEEVEAALDGTSTDDLETYPLRANRRLDEVFGQENV